LVELDHSELTIEYLVGYSKGKMTEFKNSQPKYLKIKVFKSDDHTQLGEINNKEVIFLSKYNG